MLKKKKRSSIILKITLFKHIRVAFIPLFFIGVTIFTIQHFGGIDLYNLPPLTFGLLFFVFLIAFLTLPALFLHIDYFIRNRQDEYGIGNRKIIRRKNGEEWIYLISDIDNIRLNLNHYFGLHSSSSVGGADLYTKLQPPWAKYHFAKIVMKSGEVLYLTSLLYPSGIKKVLDKYIKTSYREKERWFTTTLYCPPD